MAKNSKPAIEDGAQRIAAVVDAAEPFSVRRRPFDLPPGHSEWGFAAGWWRDQHADEWGLPVGCIVTPLGVDGDIYWFLDGIGQVRAVQDKLFSRNKIVSLFAGRTNFLMHHWPRLKGEGDKSYIDTFKPERVTDDLMAACSAKGNWNDIESVRGRGAWRGLEGELLLHCGDRLVHNVRELDLGERDGFVYPTRPAVPGPLNASLRDRPGPALALLPLLRKWNWTRPDLDPLFALGWIGAAFLSGALDWRPTIYITGDKATGKSTLQKLMKGLLGGWLVQSADTTAAGIYQRVGHDAIAVSVDELEGERDPVKQKAIIKLARLSSSGALLLRGGADHKGTEFLARNCFVLSSINTPPLEPQDLSRMALLELRPLKAGSVAPSLNDREMALLGRQILQRLVDNWSSFEARLDAYKQMLARAGHNGRGQDTFGTLLACADMIVDTDAEALKLPMGPAAESFETFEAMTAVGGMIEFEDDNPNWRLALNQVLSTPVDAWRGGLRTTVGAMLEAFWADQGGPHHPDSLDFERVNRELGSAGLALKRPTTRSVEYTLFVPNQNPSLQRLFWGSKWYGEPGSGVWAGALRQAPEGWVQAGCQGRIAGVNGRGCEFPLKLILEKMSEPAAPAEDGMEPDDVSF